MEFIIQDFAENVNSLVRKKVEEMLVEEESIEGLERVLKEELDKLGRELCSWVIEELEKTIKESKKRKKSWVVERTGDEKTILTEFGAVKYNRTYYKSKGDEGYSYLVDDKLGIDPHQRMTFNLESKLIDKAIDNSYQKSGKEAVNSLEFSDQTVGNKIKKLEKIKKEKEIEEKKEAKHLYIEADEDYIALQNGDKKVAKLVYLHEGKESTNGRVKLKNRYCFSGVYDKPEDLWLEVLNYLEENYVLEKIETIFLAGDGGAWIKEGLDWLPNTKYVLDRYHLNQYVLQATGHAEKLRSELWAGLNQADREKVKNVLQKALNKAEDENRKEAVKDTRRYINSNWSGIRNYVQEEKAIGCSAEGHISHILADRLSSRPVGWSEEGLDKMAKLRAFKFNGGTRKELKSLIEDVRQKNKHEEELEEISSQVVNSKLKKKFAAPEKNVPSIKNGKKTGTFRIFKSII